MNRAIDKISVLRRPAGGIEPRVFFIIVLLAGALYAPASAIAWHGVSVCDDISASGKR